MTMSDKNMNNMAPNPWAFQMMGGMYPQMQYNYPFNFGNRGPFNPQYFNQGMGQNGMPMMGAPNFHPGGPAAMSGIQFTAFTPGGKLESFSSIQQQDKGSNEKNKKDDSKEQPSESKEKGDTSNLPPLPPGPPPSDFANKPPLPNSAPTNNPFKPKMGPISFNFGKRPNFNNIPNAFNNQNPPNANKSSGSAKKRRKREKMNQMKRNNQDNMSSNSTMPPLPPGSPPVPPPPSPPIIGPQNENSKPIVKNLPPPIVGSGTVPPQQEAVPEWPDSFKSYVRKCYEKCKTVADRNRVDIILKKKSLNAMNDGSLYFKDWDNEPLPLLSDEINYLPMKPSYKPNENNFKKNKNGINSSLASRLGPRKFDKFENKKNARKYSPTRSRSPVKKRRYRSSSSSDRSDNRSESEEEFRSSKGDKGTHRRNEKGGKSLAKSKFYTQMGAASVPVDEELLTKRAARFGHANKQSPYSKSRKSRLESSILSPSLSSSINSSLLFEDSSGDISIPLEKHVVGTCQNIEKPYLRLTAQPEACAVRPADVLSKSLENVKDKWKTQQDYHYACEQLKSIRQDLTVQGIRDEFTVKVYEMHARIALEKGDHAEFNQCQSQLKLLYSEVSDDIAVNKREFTAYRILYYIFTKEFMDLTTQISLLTPEDKVDECISFSLKVQSSWWLGNYHRLFKLYRSAPKMTSYLMDWFLLRERKQAIKAIVKSYRQVLPVSFVHQELAFDAEKDCLEFLRLLNIIIIEEEELKIDCKASSAAMASS
nr:PREDICTED: leukocyte receptor cluster member 8 homolog isoform X1 [Bemisia tabaci]